MSRKEAFQSQYPHQPPQPAYPMNGLYQNQHGEQLPARPSKPTGAAKLNPRYWSTPRRVVGGVVVGVILLIVIVVAAVVGSRNGRYPAYKPLRYSLVSSFDPPTFYTNFDYFNAVDPAQGSAVYDNPIDAHNRNLTFTSPTSAVLRVDDKDSGPYGRHSARVSSKQTYNDGLFLFDVRHAPYGCGTWPAIWLSDAANWPANGEIDVVESVNQAASGVQTTLHTTKGCEMKGVKRVMAGKPAGADCYNGTDQNAGCGVAGAPSTFGPAFNAGGGGVYAAEVRRDGIRAWFFSRAHVPSDVSGALAPPGGDAHPDPSGWGEALADFPSTHCDVGSHFRNMSVIVDIDLCGQWAGKVYAQDGCPGDCHNYVAFTPGAFADAYWEFGGFRVFQDPAENAGAGRRGAWSWM